MIPPQDLLDMLDTLESRMLTTMPWTYRGVVSEWADEVRERVMNAPPGPQENEQQLELDLD